MKQFILMVLCVILVVERVSPVSGSLGKDVQDFVDLVDVDRVLRITNQYFIEDGDFQSLLDYLQGPEFSIVWKGFLELSIIRDLNTYLIDEGIPIYEYIETAESFIGQSSVRGRKQQIETPENHHGVKGFVDELYGALPLKEWYQMYEVKCLESASFKALMNKIRDLNFLEFHELYQNVKEVRSFVQVLRGYGVDVDSLYRNVHDFVGWKRYM